jgi:hypothetical protein
MKVISLTEYQIEENDSLSLLELKVDKAFHKLLFEKHTSSMDRLKRSTGVIMDVPPYHLGDDVIGKFCPGMWHGLLIYTTQSCTPIAIRGRRAAFPEIYRSIGNLIANDVKRLPYTHFLSFPLTAPELKGRVIEFQDELIERLRERNQIWDRSVFMNTEKLHFTIGMMKLFSEAEIERAGELLRSSFEKLDNMLSHENLHIHLYGLELMKGEKGNQRESRSTPSFSVLQETH